MARVILPTLIDNWAQLPNGDGSGPTPKMVVDAINALARSQSHPMMIGTKGQLPNSTTKGGGDTNTQHLSRVAFTTPAVPISHIQFVYANVYMAGSNAGEGSLGNDIVVSCALEGNGHAGRQMYLGGAASFTIPNGKTGLFVTDPITDGIVTPFTVMQARTLVTVTAGQFWPIGSTLGSTTGSIKAVSGAESQLLSSGAPTGTADVGQFGPIAMLGRYAGDRSQSVIMIGSSLADGTGDTQTGGIDSVVGFMARGINNVSGRPLPHSKMTMGSEGVTNLADPLLNRIRLSICRYGTEAFFDGGLYSNEIVATASLATAQAKAQQAWAVAKAAGCRVWSTDIPPRCTSTGFTSTATNPVSGQTIATNFGTGSIADSFNSWLYAQVGQGLLDGVMPVRSRAADPDNPWKWRADMIASADGVHYSLPMHVLLGGDVSIFAARNFT